MSSSLQPAQTASMTVASGAAGIMPCAFGYYPAEGSRAVSAQYNWASLAGYNEDLSQLVARGVETTIQALYVDNSSCPVSVTVTVNGTGQVIVCPAYSQGIFPAFFTGTPGFQIVAGGISNTVTRVIMLNVPPNAAGIWGVSSGGSKIIVPLDVAQVTTGGVAVTAINAGHRTGGGFISNPSGAAANLGINEIGVATGTTSAGNTTFIQPGQTYTLQASPNPVSVISTDGPHPYSGEGLQ